MEKRIILRGVLAGALGGFVAFIFGRIFAEPVIERAIDYEGGREEAQAALDRAAGLLVGHHEEHELFSRSLQQNLGAGVGMVLFGAAMGALLAVLCCVLQGRVGKLRPRTLAVLLAGGMLLALYVVPFLKYPANPPSVGHAETLGTRTTLHLVSVVLSVVFLVGAAALGRRLAPRFGNWNACLLAGGAFIVVAGIAMLLMPQLGHLPANRDAYGDFATETPQPLRDPAGTIVFPGFPADDLYLFRLYSLSAQVLMWAVIALAFAPMVQRLLGRDGDRHSALVSPEPVAR